ncbi:hypothetical protein [Pseudomonas frederiksbergensis]|uniref:hypothetical protein n=1 Tax=Pseudomonas frederiksbergensis TaxID=104087 RepID=UPI003D1D6127
MDFHFRIDSICAFVRKFRRVGLWLLALLICAALGTAYWMAPTEKERVAAYYEALEKQLVWINDARLRDAIRAKSAAMMEKRKSELWIAQFPEDPAYTLDHAALLKESADPKALTNRWLESLLYERGVFGDNPIVELRPKSSTDPDEYAGLPFPLQLSWTSATLDDGQVVEARFEPPAQDKPLALSKDKYSDELQLVYPQKNGQMINKRIRPLPITLNGEVSVLVPGNVAQFNFSRKDAGVSRSIGNLTVTLLSVGEHSAEVELRNRAPLPHEIADRNVSALLIQAQDTTGKFLKPRGEVFLGDDEARLYKEQLDTLLKQKTFSEQLAQQQQEQLTAFKRTSQVQYRTQYFFGDVKNISVTAMDFSDALTVQKTLTVPIYDFSSFVVGSAVQAMPNPVVIHDLKAEAKLSGYNMTAEQLLKTVVVDQEIVSNRLARILFRAQAALNWTYGNPKMDVPVTFYTQGTDGQRGEVIDVSPYAYKAELDKARISYDLPDFNLHEAPAYASGTMKLAHPIVEKNQYSVSALPKGMSVQGNAVILDEQAFSKYEWRVAAKDESGRYLKVMHEQAHRKSTYGDNLSQVTYFYGKPAVIEGYFLAKVEAISYPFAVKLIKPKNPCYSTGTIMMSGCM